MEWYWLTKIKPSTMKFLGLFSTFMTILVILGEITLFTDFPVGLFPLLF
jgi:hypothetical protein